MLSYFQEGASVSQTKCFLVCALSFLLLSCVETVIHTTPPAALNVNARIAVLSFINHSEIPLAGEQAKTVAAKALSVRGFRQVLVPPIIDQKRNLMVKNKKVKSYKEQLQWARHIGAKYMLIGNIKAWDYLAILGCKPLISVTLQLIDVTSGRTVWTADGSKRGEPRVTVAALTAELTHAMLVRLCASTPTPQC